MNVNEIDFIEQEIKQLSPQSLVELREFIAYLQYKEMRRGSPWVREMYDAFAPVREAVDQMGLTEAEIDAIIDDTIDEVRRERD